MGRGLFISFEGTEGCGKSTQIHLLKEALVEKAREVVLTREPGGTPAGEAIRHLLQFSPDGAAITPETELLLFTASRAQLVREVIRPALARGATVLSDRFLDSTTVYQGVARKVPATAVQTINEFAVGDCVPDITIVLDLHPEEAAVRLADRECTEGELDRMEQEPMDFYIAVRNAYLELARSQPDRIHVVDANQPPADIAKQILTLVRSHGL